MLRPSGSARERDSEVRPVKGSGVARGRIRLGLSLLIGSAAGAGLLLWLGPTLEDPDAYTRFLDQVSGNPWTPVLLLAVMLLCGVAIVPVAPATVTVGALYGVAGIPLAVTGMTAGALAGYGLGRWLGGERLVARMPPGRVRALMDLVRRNGASASILARWIPGLPFAAQNVLLGAVRVPWPLYAVGSIVGVSVVQGAFLLAGQAGSELVRQEGVETGLGWLIPFAGAVTGLYLLGAGRRAAKAEGAVP